MTSFNRTYDGDCSQTFNKNGLAISNIITNSLNENESFNGKRQNEKPFRPKIFYSNEIFHIGLLRCIIVLTLDEFETLESLPSVSALMSEVLIRLLGGMYGPPLLYVKNHVWTNSERKVFKQFHTARCKEFLDRLQLETGGEELYGYMSDSSMGGQSPLAAFLSPANDESTNEFFPHERPPPLSLLVGTAIPNPNHVASTDNNANDEGVLGFKTKETTHSSGYINVDGIVCPRPWKFVPALACDIEATIPFHDVSKKLDFFDRLTKFCGVTESMVEIEGPTYLKGIRKVASHGLLAGLEKVADDFENNADN